MIFFSKNIVQVNMKINYMNTLSLLDRRVKETKNYKQEIIRLKGLIYMPHLYNFIPLFKISQTNWCHGTKRKSYYLAWIYTGNSQIGATAGLTRTLHDITLSFSGVGGTNISLENKQNLKLISAKIQLYASLFDLI